MGSRIPTKSTPRVNAVDEHVDLDANILLYARLSTNEDAIAATKAQMVSCMLLVTQLQAQLQAQDA